MPTAGIIFLLFVQGSGAAVIRRRGHGSGPTKLKPRGWWDEPRPWWQPRPTISVKSELAERQQLERQERDIRAAYRQLRKQADEIEEATIALAMDRHQEELNERESKLPVIVRELPSILLNEEMRTLQKKMDDKKMDNRVKMARLRARRKHAS